jgi:hypothetical protein
MASVNQMAKTHSKPLAAQHAMCELAFIGLPLVQTLKGNVENNIL